MRRADPFTPFLNHEDIRDRRVSAWERGSTVDDFLDAPDRAALERRFALPRLRLLSIAAGLIALSIIGRLMHLQLVIGATFRDQAENNRVKRVSLPAPRGIIEDRFGRPLTANTPTFLLTISPKDLPPDPSRLEQLLTDLGALSGISRPALNDLVAKPAPDGTVIITKSLSLESAIRSSVRFTQTPGIAIIPIATRTYQDGSAASHVLGYLGQPTDAEIARGYAPTDRLGRNGLEAQYEDVLRGRNGQREIERDSTNREQRVIATVPPTPGNNIVVTIDAELQSKLFQELDGMVKRLHASGGSAVALDPRTGEVLALVSSPSFDNNDFGKGLTTDAYRKLTTDPKLPLFNRAVSGEYPSGSTIKPFVAAAALDEGIITPTTQILSTGGLTIGRWFFPDWKSGGHGPTNVTKAIAESVNTFFYTIGGGTDTFTGLGIDRLTQYARRFTFGSQTGIDLPGEQEGFLPSKDWKEKVKKERWYIGDTYHFAIGQGDVLVTPLQLATGTAAVANGGRVYRPRLLKAITDPSNRLVTNTTPTIIEDHAATAGSLRAVRDGMRQAVLSGSARGLADLPVSAAGKTGTAQFGSGESTHAWFTSFAPYEDPAIVLTVLVEGGGEGHAAALPVARNVLSWYFTRSAPSTNPQPNL